MLSITLPPLPAIPPAEVYQLGTVQNPSGSVIGVDPISLRLNGDRWMPVMGELHYARVPKTEWRDALLKMKAGGIDIVSTYVFWIHHEETEGAFNWNGDRALGEFVRIAGDVGLKVVVRIGPWCHGEVRNGGLPDWIQAMPKARTDDAEYLTKVRQFFTAISQQLDGLLWKQGGPIVAFQIENEYSGPAEHLLTLKRLAREVGLDAPFYTRTGWPDLATPLIFGELLPLYGAYPEGFWDRELTAMPGFYPAGFRFSHLRTDAGIATDLLGKREAADIAGTERYPFLTCELGGGMMSSYHRRIHIEPQDIEAVVLTKLGSGGNLPGYYMYHGGINPEGRTSMQESQATKYWNDLPEKNYDFQAPIGAAGQLRPHYHRLRRLHLFVHDFGALLAGMPSTLPEKRPSSLDDASTPRWSVRSAGDSGFVFVNNYERLRDMPAKENIQFALSLQNPDGKLTFPTQPVTIPANASFIWPFGLDLAPGVRLDHASVQLLCKIEEGRVHTFFFAATDGVPAEFAFNGRPPRVLKAARGVAAHVAGKDGAEVRIVVLGDTDSLALWKANWRGRDRVFLTRAGLTIDGEELVVSAETSADLHVSAFPAPEPNSGSTDGIFQAVALNESITDRRAGDALAKTISSKRDQGVAAPSENRTSASPAISVKLVREAGPAREIQLGWTTPAVATAPTDPDFAKASVWQITFPAGSDFTHAPLLRIHYTGDVARIRIGTRLVLDDFYNGDALEVDLDRYANELASGAALTIEILPLRPDAPILLPAGKRPRGTDAVARVDNVEWIPSVTARAQPAAKIAARPLFRDPVYDGAADPIVIWNRSTNAWWMFYTNRRANAEGVADIAWIHGTRIGIAESRNNGATWSYQGTAAITLPAEFGTDAEVTHWAPDIIEHEGVYHMYLTVVPGVFTDWEHPRAIVHVTSPDLKTWTYRSTLKLTSDRVIDASVTRLPDGRWRMWYNDERAGKAINAADSIDLFNWTDLGLVDLPNRQPGEGPKVFRFANAFWMIVDEWKGLGVYRSEDAVNWTRQSGENLLSHAGTGPDDASIGAHADVVVNDGRAWLFYFTHPEKTIGVQPATNADLRRSTIHVTELSLHDGQLTCDRDAPQLIHLKPQS